METTLNKKQRNIMYKRALEIFESKKTVDGLNLFNSLCWTFTYLFDSKYCTEQRPWAIVCKHNKHLKFHYYDGIPMDKCIGKVLPEFYEQKPKQLRYSGGDSFWFYGLAYDNYNARIKILKKCIKLTE